MLKTIRNLIIAISFLILSFGIGYKLGAKNLDFESFKNTNFIGKTSSVPKSVDFTLFWDVWDRLSRTYIDKKNLDPQKMVFGAISGMVASLGDPYTVFLPPDQNKEAKDDLGGKFEGIGAQLGIKDKKIVVVAPLKGTPADKAGLKPGDWIIKVDGKETFNWTLPETVSKIRGPKNSKVLLNIMHKDSSKSADLEVVRDDIKVASVDWYMNNVKCQNLNENCQIIKESCASCRKIVYLQLGKFGDQTTDEWKKAIAEIGKELQKSPSEIKGMILDLRNNPGGYLSASVYIASEFLSDGIVVIQESVNQSQQQYKVNRKGDLLKIPLVVLINKGSASASEIVAGSLQDRGRAKLVGETSFGKGTIQEPQELPGGAGIHITTAKWLLPSGIWINGTGVIPDVKIENDEAKPEEDLQLEKGIETLLK